MTQCWYYQVFYQGLSYAIVRYKPSVLFVVGRLLLMLRSVQLALGLRKLRVRVPGSVDCERHLAGQHFVWCCFRWGAVRRGCQGHLPSERSGGTRHLQCLSLLAPSSGSTSDFQAWRVKFDQRIIIWIALTITVMSSVLQPMLSFVHGVDTCTLASRRSRFLMWFTTIEFGPVSHLVLHLKFAVAQVMNDESASSVPVF